jgi:hypothetical protein
MLPVAGHDERLAAAFRQREMDLPGGGILPGVNLAIGLRAEADGDWALFYRQPGGEERAGGR